jgi:hypothetical protein
VRTITTKVIATPSRACARGRSGAADGRGRCRTMPRPSLCDASCAVRESPSAPPARRPARSRAARHVDASRTRVVLSRRLHAHELAVLTAHLHSDVGDLRRMRPRQRHSANGASGKRSAGLCRLCCTWCAHEWRAPYRYDGHQPVEQQVQTHRSRHFGRGCREVDQPWARLYLQVSSPRMSLLSGTLSATLSHVSVCGASSDRRRHASAKQAEWGTAFIK